MPIPHNYDTVVYPNNIDAFRVVFDGNTPTNLILSSWVNKVSNCLMAVERHTQYTVDTPTATGYYLLGGTQGVQLQADLPDPGLLFNVPITVFPSLASQFFSGNPFNRNNAIFVTGVGYHIVGGNRNYFPCRAAVNTGAELGNITLSVNVVKTTDKWRAGDFCEVTLTIVRLPV